MKNTLLLALNDLAIAFKNKTLLLVLFIPVFVFVALNLVDKADDQTEAIKIGMLEDHSYAPHIADSQKPGKITPTLPCCRIGQNVRCTIRKDEPRARQVNLDH